MKQLLMVKKKKKIYLNWQVMSHVLTEMYKKMLFNISYKTRIKLNVTNQSNQIC